MQSGFVRIIAGKWRGRRLQVPDVAGLRPTPDRVRETLFNWLAPIIPGTYCLDLFAGSGVLGFEALSRGAVGVVMIDCAPKIVALLKEQAQKLDATDAEIIQANVPKGLPKLARQFDIVFLDPPYHEDLLFPTAQYLEANNCLADSALIYLEAKNALQDEDLPANWRIIKSQKAGQVFYHLAERTVNRV